MKQDTDSRERGSPLRVTRRTVLTASLMTAAMPAAMTKALADVATRPDSASGAVKPLYRQFYTTTESALGTVVAGGYRFGALSAVQVFDGVRWHDAPSLLTPRYYHAAVALRGGVLVMGGISSDGFVLSDAEIFDGERWTRVAPMGGPRAIAAALIYEGAPMITGGRNRAPLSSVEVFDGTRWTPYPSLAGPRYGHVAALVNGWPSVSGGANLGPLSTSESYNGTLWSPAQSALTSSAAL